MGELRSYSAIATKIRAMKSRILRYEDYESIADLENIWQAAEYLCRIPSYKAVFDGMELSLVQRSDMEHLLIGSLYVDFLKLYRFGNNAQKEILKLYFRKYEIAEIKHTLRHVLNRGEASKAPPVLQESMQKFTKIDLERLRNAQTVSDLTAALQETPYGELMENTGVLEKKSLFDCEMVLDLFYFTELWKKINKLLKKKECSLLAESFGYRIDLLNITWIYRAKKYYKVTDTAVYGLLIPVRYKLREKDIRDMVCAQDIESLDKVIRSTAYGHKFKGMEISGLENFYYEFLQKIYADERRRNPYSIAVVTGYLYEKEEEIRKLTTVLEGIWYGLPKEETLAYLKDS